MYKYFFVLLPYFDIKLFTINLDQITVIDMPTKVKPKEQLKT